MTLSNIDAVRLRTSDRPTLQREVAEGDGVTSAFRMQLYPLLSLPVARAWNNDVLLAISTDYTLDLVDGIFNLVAPPAVNDRLLFEYPASVFSDDEIQYFLDGASSNVTLAAAGVLFAWAANAAKLAKKESAAGGGGFGSVTLDLAVRAKELRDSARAYVDHYQTFENSGIPVEGLTEVGWTLESGYRLILRDIIRGTSI